MRKSTNILSRPTKGQWGFMLLFGLPPFLLFVFITVVPMIRSVIYSFYAGDGVTWVGFKNYAALLSDANFYAPMLNDFLILLLKEVIVIVVSVIFAISITRLSFRRGETSFLRFIYYIPNILSVVVIAKVWKYFFDFDLVSQIFGTTMPSNGWINTYPVPIITFVASWCGIGMFMIILIAAINNISKELYEAADLDGANQFRQLFSITLPALLPQMRYMAVSIVISIVASNTNFVKLFMGDSSGGSGFTVMGVYEYNAFERMQYETAYAAAVIIMVIVFAISYLLNTLIRDKEENQL